MPRPIHLAIFKNPAHKPAHWALFIPSPSSPLTGKILHATGNTATGFFLQFKRNVDLHTETREYKLLLLADEEERFVRDTPWEGVVEDTIARDRVESVALGSSARGQIGSILGRG